MLEYKAIPLSPFIPKDELTKVIEDFLFNINGIIFEQKYIFEKVFTLNVFSRFFCYFVQKSTILKISKIYKMY